MKRNYIIIYSLLILSLIVLIIFFLFNYSSRTTLLSKKYNKIEGKELVLENSNKDKKEKEIISNDILQEATVIENIEYTAMDAAGNKFIISADKGERSTRNYNKVYLINVVANIELQNAELIKITADFADYDKILVETLFKDNVKINYINHEVESDKLHLSFEDKLASINNNVVYKNEDTKMFTDNIEIDFKTKKTKIFMNNNSDQVFVKTKY